jgi:sulfite reductase (ferredoxin)
VLPYAENLTSKLIAESDSFTLPRKFKIAFSCSDLDNGFAAFNDLGFIAKIRDNQRGFRVLIGGSLGLKPMIGFELFDFMPEEDLFYVAEAAKRLFSENGNRKNKHKARLRYVFYRLGKEEVFRLFHEIYNELKQNPELKYVHTAPEKKDFKISIVPEANNSPELHKWKERYVKDQQQDQLKSVIIPLQYGNIHYEKLIQLAEFLGGFGEDVLRFSMRQNIQLRNISEKYLGNVFNFLNQLGIETQSPLLVNSIVTCTGADTCRLGICLAKGAGNALKKGLAKSNLDLDKLADLRINLSGCPNSCGQHVAADLGFFGRVSRNDRMYPAYNIVAGAQTGKDPRLAELLGDISARDIPSFTAELLGIYQSKQEQYISFSDYIQKDGKNDIAELSAKYNSNIPAFSEDKNFYYDWGSENVFSLVSRGVGECSAGLFDMIDVDLNKINSSIPLLEKASVEERNEILHTILFSSVRMLLITRGAEPKSTEEVYNSFVSRFIDAGLVNEKYRNLVISGTETAESDYSSKKEQILTLAKEVIALYESMDDSLQFKNTPQKEMTAQKPYMNVTSKEIVADVRKKDLRGVVCPMNFVKTKIELATLKSGDLLNILLDNGAPIENVPGSVMAEGHKIVEQKQIADHWSVTIQKS